MLARAPSLLALSSILASCCASGGHVDPDAWRAPPPPVPRQYALANGLSVDLDDGACGGHGAIALLFDVGTNDDPAHRSGLLRVIERLVAPGDGVLFRVEEDYSVYAVQVVDDDLLDAVSRTATRFAQPTLTDADLTRARTEVLDDIRARSGGDAALTARTLAAEAVEASPGRGRRGGIASEVEAITLSEVQDFWRAHLAQANAHLVVTGAFDAEDARARIQSAFAAMPAGTAPARREPSLASVRGTLVMGNAPTAIAIGVLAPARSDPLYPAFLVLATRAIRAGDGSRAWHAAYDPTVDASMLFVTGPVPEGAQPEPIANGFRAQLGDVLAPALTPEDVEATRTQFGRLLGAREHSEARCAESPRDAAIARARSRQLFEDAPPTLDEVTDAQLTEARALLSPERTAAVIAGGALE